MQTVPRRLQAGPSLKCRTENGHHPAAEVAAEGRPTGKDERALLQLSGRTGRSSIGCWCNMLVA